MNKYELSWHYGNFNILEYLDMCGFCLSEELDNKQQVFVTITALVAIGV